MRNQRERLQLVLTLVVNPRLNQVLGEDAALEQEVVVSLQSRQSLLQVSRSLLDVLSLFSGQLVQVLVDRCRRLDTVTDTVQTQPSAEQANAKVGVSGKESVHGTPGA